MLGAHRRRAIGFGQTVNMRQIETHFFHAFDHRHRRCRARDQAMHRVVDTLLHRRRGIEQQVMHNRRAAIVRDLVRANQIENRLRVDAPQTHIGARRCRDCPRETPAVAVKHRQRPQIHRMRCHAPRHDVAHRVEIRAAVVIHHALGVTRGARGVVKGERVPLLVRHFPGKIRVPLGNECFVVDAAQQLAALERGIIHIDHQWFVLHQRKRFFDRRGKLAVGEQHLRFTMIEHECDCFGIEPRVQRVQHGAAHRHTEMRLIHRGDVGQHRRHRVTHADATLRERRCQPPATGIHLAPTQFLRTVNHRNTLGIHARRAPQQRQRR